MYQKEIVIKWHIKGFENYGFGEDKNLYNLKRNTKVKHCLKRYTKGFNLNGKFISDNNLKLLITKPTKPNLPF